MENILIFGASKYGEWAYDLLKSDYNIVSFCDNNPSKWGIEFKGIMVNSPEQLGNMKYDKIVIASQYYLEINKQLINMGLNNIYYVHCYIDLTGDCSNRYKLFKISDFPLFSNSSVDREKVEDIENDFSLNYVNVDVEEREVGLFEKNNVTKNVLVCAYGFPPIGGSGIQRTLKFVKYLHRYHYNPIVLTTSTRNMALQVDKTLTDEISKDIKVIKVNHNEIVPGVLDDAQQQEILNLYAAIVKSDEWIAGFCKSINETESEYFIPDNTVGWVNDCLKEVEQHIDFNDIDVIYTTAPPFGVHFLGYFLSKKYGKKWVMDYRDPWLTNDHYLLEYRKECWETLELQKVLERRLVEQADAVINMAPQAAADFNEKYNVAKEKLHVITNGYDEVDFENIDVKNALNSKFTLCYNGMIYIDRNPLGLINCINELIDSNKVDGEEIQLVFNGTIESDWKVKIENIDRHNIVKYNGYLSHKDSIESAMSSDVLVLFGAMGAGADVIYTGKVFEYLRMRVPILCFSRKTGVLAELMEETKAGKNFEYDDADGISEYVLELYTAWKGGDPIRNDNGDVIKKYSREYHTQQLATVFDKVLA